MRQRRIALLGLAVGALGRSRPAFSELPWKSSLPPLSDPRWEALGRELITSAQQLDTGRTAFEECHTARQQLQTIVQGIGYDMTVSTFGGISTMRMLEAGGDADFVGVANVEPSIEEAGEIVSRISREMRRLGLRASAIPRARVPVVKVDRTSRAIPGSPLHSLARTGIFRFSRELSSEEQDSFALRLKADYECLSVEWCNNKQTATVTFQSSTELVAALTVVDRHGSVPVPLRLPLEPRNGPEIYRMTFDFVLSSIGLRNSFIFGQVLSDYEYSRHLLLAVKRWGRSSNVVNTVDGMLASYALTVMLVHFLCKLGIVKRVQPSELTCEPHTISADPIYEPLAAPSTSSSENAQVGYLLAAFFEYYGTVFDYSNSVVCTTNMNLTKERLKWNRLSETGRPPFFALSIKDPCGLDNIGRNLSPESTAYVIEAINLAFQTSLKDLNDPAFLVKLLTTSAPRPIRSTAGRPTSFTAAGATPQQGEQAEAWHMLKKMEFQHRRHELERFGQRTVKKSAQQKVAQDLTTNMLSWIQSGSAIDSSSSSTGAAAASIDSSRPN